MFAATVTAGPAVPLVVQIKIDDAITPVMAAYVKDAIAYADSQKAEALLISLDTPGGLMETTREIVQSILAAPMPIIVYVAPSGARAGSAGVFITLAADIAAMAPSTRIGAAHPVGLMGGDIEGEMKKKIENDAAAWARSLAQNKGRNADWAEKAVRESVSIPEKQALHERVVDVVANDVSHLLSLIDARSIDTNGEQRKIQTKNAKIDHFEMSGQQQLVKWLSNPNLLYLLLLLGFLGLFIEFQFPGLILPGLLGVVCLAVVFGVQVLPINWLGAVLILGAIALFVAEIYITSFGLLAIGGLALFVLGSYLLFDVPGSTFQVDPIMIWSFASLALLLLMGFGYLILRAKGQGPTSGIDAMRGQRAIVFERIEPNKPGSIHFQGGFWQAHADEELATDTEVIIERMEGAHAYVKRSSKQESV